jgi:AcrR family transcriptional regulator
LSTRHAVEKFKLKSAVKSKTPKRRVTKQREYNSEIRTTQTAATRSRILAAASELAHAASSWDWRELTIRAIAERAGIAERTMYRYFSTEKELHDGLMQRLHEEAGVSYATTKLDELPEFAARSFASWGTFAVPPTLAVRHPTFVAVDQTRTKALKQALRQATVGWSEADREIAAGALDVLMMPTAYDRLINSRKMNLAAATRAVTWAIDVLIAGIRSGHKPSIKPTSAKKPATRKRAGIA